MTNNQSKVHVQMRNKDCAQVKRKCGRPPKQKIEQNEIKKPAANTRTT